MQTVGKPVSATDYRIGLHLPEGRQDPLAVGQPPSHGEAPFQLDTKPLPEPSSPHAGALATSRAFRALGLPELIAAHLHLRQRRRGFSEAQLIESAVLLQTIGGDTAPMTCAC